MKDKSKILQIKKLVKEIIPKPVFVQWQCIKCHKTYTTSKQPAQCKVCGSMIFNDL